MQVNYLGAVYCTHYALPYLKANRGLLVAISSLCGKTAVPTRTGYVASKHAMQGFFDTLRIELREVEWMCWLCHRGLLQQISDKGL